MNVQDAAHETVHSYPGGSASLAPRVGMNPTVLRSKVNPTTTTHHLTLAEASRIMGVSGDHRILHALAAEHGYTVQPIEEEGADNGSTLGAVLNASAAEGEFDQVLASALADGVLTNREFKAIGNAAAKQTAALVLLVRKLGQQAGRAQG